MALIPGHKRLAAGGILLALLAAAGLLWVARLQDAPADRPARAQATERPTGEEAAGQVPPPGEPLSPAAITLLGQGSSRRYHARLAAIHGLGSELSATDIGEMLEYLSDPATARPGNRWDLALKNDLLGKLIHQETIPAALPGLMHEIIADPGQDLLWRDYLIQHLPMLVDQWQARHDTDTLGRQTDSLRETLAAALDQNEAILAGTALLAMHRLADGDAPIITPAETLAAARRLLDDPATSHPSRITAIHVLGERADASGFLPEAIAIANDTHRPILERMSAIAILGRAATPQALAILRPIAEDTTLDPRLRNAAALNLTHNPRRTL